MIDTPATQGNRHVELCASSNGAAVFDRSWAVQLSLRAAAAGFKSRVSAISSAAVWTKAGQHAAVPFVPLVGMDGPPDAVQERDKQIVTPIQAFFVTIHTTIQHSSKVSYSEERKTGLHVNV